MKRYYVLKENGVLNEEKYKELRKSEYEQIKAMREEEGEPLKYNFEEWFEEEPDWDLKTICEIDEEEFKDCKTLDELNGVGLRATGLEDYAEVENESMSNNYSLAIENGSWSYNLNGYDYLDLQFKVIEEDKECPEDTKIEFDFYQFI